MIQSICTVAPSRNVLCFRMRWILGLGLGKCLSFESEVTGDQSEVWEKDCTVTQGAEQPRSEVAHQFRPLEEICRCNSDKHCLYTAPSPLV